MEHLAYDWRVRKLIQIDTQDSVHLDAQGAIDQDVGRTYQKCLLGEEANLVRSFAARSSFKVVSLSTTRTLMVGLVV